MTHKTEPAALGWSAGSQTGISSSRPKASLTLARPHADLIGAESKEVYNTEDFESINRIRFMG